MRINLRELPRQNIVVPSRQQGNKSIQQEKSLVDYLKKYPNAVIARFTPDGEMIVEKPVVKDLELTSD